jgi:Uma2 family endonuclease
VKEYWIADWRLQQVEVYRRQSGILKLMVTLLDNDELSSPLLPGFSCAVSRFFV